MAARAFFGDLFEQAEPSLLHVRQARPRVVENLHKRLVHVEGRGESSGVDLHVPDDVRVLLAEPRRKPEGKVRHALFQLPLRGGPDVVVPGAVVRHEDEQGGVQVAAVLQVFQESHEVVVQGLHLVVVVVAHLRVEAEEELGEVPVHVEQVPEPVHEVDVARPGPQAQRRVVLVHPLRRQVERPHVVVRRLVPEAQHPQLKGAHVRHVLRVRRDVAASRELPPDPRVVVDRRGPREPPPGLRKLLFHLACEDREEGGRRAVAHDVVARELRSSQAVEEVVASPR